MDRANYIGVEKGLLTAFDAGGESVPPMHILTIESDESSWTFQFLPPSGVRGGGVRVKVQKETYRVLDVLHYQ